MMGATFTVASTCLALGVALVVGFVCLVVADGRQTPSLETWDNGLATVRTDNFDPDVKLDVSQVEKG